MTIPNHDANLLPPDDEEIGPCADCPGMCSIEEHWESDETGNAGCDQHDQCGGFVEYTRAQAVEDFELEWEGM